MTGTALAWAQNQPAQRDEPTPARLEPVIVTGSHIPRIDAETALPVQVITREEIERTGVTTPAHLLDKLPANLYGFNDTLTLGQAGTPGMATASLRGLGDGSTLVLLNGRRLANYGFYGAAVDINSIPLSAVERVEILKDGASAIYGSDAIAGVINFVLRKDFAGVELSAYATATEQGGGNTQLLTAAAGVGRLATDRYNVFVTASYQKNEQLLAVERDFALTGHRPELSYTLSSMTFPANIADTPRRREINPTYPQCGAPQSLPVPPLACGFDTRPQEQLLPAVERASVLARGTWQTSAASELFAEALWSRNTFDKQIGASPIISLTPVGLNLYPAGGPYYPTAFAAANGLSGDLRLVYRTAELGPRRNTVVSEAQRYAVGAEGSLDLWRARWDYSLAVTYSRNTQSDTYTGGSVYASRLVPAMRTGLINPFGASGPEGRALLEATVYTGTPHTSEATTSAINGVASVPVTQLPAGPLTMAIGAEARREDLASRWDPSLQSGDPWIGSTPTSVAGDRKVNALFGELSIPIAARLEAQLALRFDDYSDFGSSTNPKIALRWKAADTLLFRGSWGTGFRAPPLYDLYRSTSTQLPFIVRDPVRCPVTGLPTDCRPIIDVTFGGNPALKPETSTQWVAGALWQPTPGFSIGLDFWTIDIEEQIRELGPNVAAQFYETYSDRFIRGPVDPAFPGLPGPLTGVSLSPVNFGHTTASGVDAHLDWKSPSAGWGTLQLALQATYMRRWETQLNGVDMVSMVGTDAFLSVIPRWRSLLTLGWNRGLWGATLSQTYTHGYRDFAPGLDGLPRRVDSYSLWDVQATYIASPVWRFAAGVRNLLDTDPPATNQRGSFQYGFEPQLTNPLGRLLYVKVTAAWR